MAQLPAPIRIPFAAASVMLLCACSFSEPTLQETRELELTVSPGTELFIEAGAGPLKIEGDDGEAIRVEAGIYQRSANDDYQLSLETDSEDRARLVANTASSMVGSSDYIDLVVRIPRSMQVMIEDGSGSIRISGIDGDLELEDGSGSITISTVGGSVAIEDGSGSITMEDIGGDVRIDDGSGSITITRAGGTVSVSDGSGSITVTDAEDFELREDGSGSVTLEGIRSRGGSN